MAGRDENYTQTGTFEGMPVMQRREAPSMPSTWVLVAVLVVAGVVIVGSVFMLVFSR